jgi:hypothetical protein
MGRAGDGADRPGDPDNPPVERRSLVRALVSDREVLVARLKEEDGTAFHLGTERLALGEVVARHVDPVFPHVHTSGCQPHVAQMPPAVSNGSFIDPLAKDMTTRSYTKPETWTIKEIHDALSGEGPGRRIQLPKFQRTLVWSAGQRQELLRSLRLGHPVGSLLMYEMPNGGTQKVYQLVDGLQRVSAIQDYLAQPLAYLAEGGLDDPLLEKLFGVLSQASGGGLEPESVEQAVGEWMAATRDLEAGHGYSPHKLINSVIDSLSLDVADEVRQSMYDGAGAVLDGIKEQIDIAQISVPVLLFSGDASELPDIFEKLNSAGTALSKYEIYAATWVEQETRIENAKIRDAIALKYQELLDQGYEIAGLDSEGHSLFEYLFGLGKELCERFPLLFGAPTQTASPEAIGFTLMTVAHQVEVPDMKQLPRVLRTSPAEPIDPTAFEAALLEAVEIVNGILLPCVGLRLNEQGRATLVVHTQFQIASMICRVLAAAFRPFEWIPTPDADEDIDRLKETLLAHYLYDIVRGTWRSAGDRRVFARTWVKDEEGDGAYRPSHHYMTALSWFEVEQVLDVWFEEQLQRAQKTRSHVRGIDKLFLKLVYSDVVTVHDHATKTFELEHLFPVSRLADIVRDEPEGWPISAVSNLALFESRLNREKFKKTISEYMQGLSDDVLEDKKAEMDRYLLCEIEDVSIPQEFGGDAITLGYFESFLRSRFTTMKQNVRKALKY